MEEDDEDRDEGRGLQGHSNADRRSRSSFTCIKLLFVSDRQQPSIEQLKLQTWQSLNPVIQTNIMRTKHNTVLNCVPQRVEIEVSASAHFLSKVSVFV